jgi:Skp family chaperone for outer membrane proteins
MIMENGERRTIRWYEVIYVVVLLALLVMSVFYMNPHKVAVLDVDRVFKEIGLVEKIEADRQKLDAYNRGQALVKAYNTRMSGLKTKLDEAKTQVDKDKIQSQIKSANEMMQQNLAPIQNALQTHEGNVVTTFRRRLQPFVAKVAKKRRVDLVIYAGPSLLYVKSSVDITSDVVKASKEFFAKDMPLVEPTPGAASAPVKKK